MDRSHQLAQFLRARRERVKPEDARFGADRRRAPGLRREEVAMLAGISAGYYMRLEQGRANRPSQQVLEGLARALRLDHDATAHLFSLGRPAPPAAQPRSADDQTVHSDLQELLDHWSTTTPAFIHDRRLDVLASNALARALTPLSEPGTNLLRSWFLDLEDRERYDDVEFVLTQAVAYFRSTAGSDPDDRKAQDLVDELSRQSEDFRRIWARHDVQPGLSGEGPLYHHPTLGALRLRYRTFAIIGTDGLSLYVVSAAPGSRDAHALTLLGTMLGDVPTSTPPSPTAPAGQQER